MVVPSQIIHPFDEHNVNDFENAVIASSYLFNTIEVGDGCLQFEQMDFGMTHEPNLYIRYFTLTYLMA